MDYENKETKKIEKGVQEVKSNENVVETPQNATFSFFYLVQSA